MPPLPEGWEIHPAGSIGGDLMEGAFDPLRHDVTIVWNGRLDPAVARGIASAGWQPMECTDSAQIWSRDRLVTAMRQLIGSPRFAWRARRHPTGAGSVPLEGADTPLHRAS